MTMAYDVGRTTWSLHAALSYHVSMITRTVGRRLCGCGCFCVSCQNIIIYVQYCRRQTRENDKPIVLYRRLMWLITVQCAVAG